MSTVRPKLTLIGALGLVAGTALLCGCDDDTKMAVERASYATRADCERDWSRPDDCTDAQGRVHGGVGLWYGPYYTRSGTVYHADGSETHEKVATRNAVATSEEEVSSRALSHGGTEGIARGGFGEPAHGGGGEGGHGGEGGGHGG